MSASTTFAEAFRQEAVPAKHAYGQCQTQTLAVPAAHDLPQMI